MYYRLNNGTSVHLRTSDNGVTILNVPNFDVNASGVREGRQIRGTNEYRIFIELYSEGGMETRASFKIWNIPGMKVTHENQVVEIKTAAELAAMTLKDSNANYILANDIIVSGAWTPIGTDVTPFTGKLYGNGHTIAFTGDSSISGGGKYMGLFGYAQNAVICDLTFEYNAPVINVTTGNSRNGYENWEDNIFYNIGGIAGYLKDTTVRNVITSGGTLNINRQAGNEVIRLGGIAGYIEGSGKIENCRAALSTKYTLNGNAGSSELVGGIAIGAVAGETGVGAGTNTIPFDNGLYNSPKSLSGLLINGITIAADVDAHMNLSGKTYYIPSIYIGGAVGKSGRNTMNDITFTAGNISFSGNKGEALCGGIVGQCRNTNIVKSFFAGNITNSETYDTIRLGGLVGEIWNASPKENYIDKCQVLSINIEAESDYLKTVGGFLGYVFDFGATITNCFLENVNITLEGSADVKTGGFLGDESSSLAAINNCGVFSGTITVGKKGKSPNSIEVGGFASVFTGNISNCFSKVDIETTGTCRQTVGGFVGSLNGGTIKTCYATGNIDSQVTGDYRVGIGGLAGGVGGTVQNSYALGNIAVYKKTGPVDENYNTDTFAGGLVGILSGDIETCFSAGTVKIDARIGKAYSGGIVGGIFSGTIISTAALGTYVIADAPGGYPAGYNTGRIYGYPTTNLSLPNSYDGNYAFEKMNGGITITNDKQSYQGESTPISNFITSIWWVSTLHFPSWLWDFSTPVVYRGYPLLKGLPGQL